MGGGEAESAEEASVKETRVRELAAWLAVEGYELQHAQLEATPPVAAAAACVAETEARLERLLGRAGALQLVSEAEAEERSRQARAALRELSGREVTMEAEEFAALLDAIFAGVVVALLDL